MQAIGRSTFDVDVGPIIERMIMISGTFLSPEDHLQIASLSLPHTQRSPALHQIQYTFHYKHSTVYVIFRQKQDASIRRGYYQKSVFLMTSFPCHAIEKMMVIMADALFTNVDLDEVFADMQGW